MKPFIQCLTITFVSRGEASKTRDGIQRRVRSMKVPCYLEDVKKFSQVLMLGLPSKNVCSEGSATEAILLLDAGVSQEPPGILSAEYML